LTKKPSKGRKPDKTSEPKRMKKNKVEKSEPEKLRNPIPESEPCFEKKMFERSELREVRKSKCGSELSVVRNPTKLNELK